MTATGGSRRSPVGDLQLNCNSTILGRFLLSRDAMRMRGNWSYSVQCSFCCILIFRFQANAKIMPSIECLLFLMSCVLSLILSPDQYFESSTLLFNDSSYPWVSNNLQLIWVMTRYFRSTLLAIVRRSTKFPKCSIICCNCVHDCQLYRFISNRWVACDCDEGFAGGRCERNIRRSDDPNSNTIPASTKQCKGEW